jgi:hypothetical protein
MYLAADAGSGFHIWRQAFPDGAPEQLTFGPTEEEGIAMAPDGRSFITAVGLRQTTVWVRDAEGERPLSSEGNATQPQFSPDGKRVYYLKQRTTPSAGHTDTDRGGYELWVVDVATGRAERLLTGLDIDAYDLSEDGRRVAFRTPGEGQSTLWVAPVDRTAAPQSVASSASFRGSGLLLIGDDLLFLEDDGGELASGYRVNVTDGRKERLVANVNGALGSSPAGRWIVAAVPARDREGTVRSVAYRFGGGAPVPICSSLCTARWGLNGRYFYLSFLRGGDAGVGRTFVAPLTVGQILPDLPPSGLCSPEEAGRMPGWLTIEHPESIVPGPTPSIYAFTRSLVHRNLYRIPVP